MINNSTFLHSQENSTFIKADHEEFNILSFIHVIIIGLAIIHILYLILMLIKLNCFKSKNDDDKNPELRKINESCVICLSEITDEVQLLCSHSFCAKCIVDYAKVRYSFINVPCPYCRTSSKLMIMKFEKTDVNQHVYEEILTYNHQLTSKMSTSLCLCVDTFRFFMYFSRQLLDFNNPRYQKERCCLMCIFCVAFVIIIFPIIGKISDFWEIIEDIIVYSFLICAFAEGFYRRVRNNTNREFDEISEINNSFAISNADQNEVQNNNNNQVAEMQLNENHSNNNLQEGAASEEINRNI